jgi:hypothetical protein
MGSLAYSLNESTALYGSAGIVHYRDSYSSPGFSGDFSDTNPGGAAGVIFLLDAFNLSAGVTFVAGGEDEDSSIGLTAAISRALGG